MPPTRPCLRVAGASPSAASPGRAGRPRARTATIRWRSACCTSTARLCTTGRRSPCSGTCTGPREATAMPYEFQIAVDSGQPHVLADWWAETLGWLVEPTDEAFIRKMIAEGYASDEDTMTHNGALYGHEGAASR